MIELQVIEDPTVELGITESFNGGGGTPAVLIDKTITANGTYNASSDSADGYKKVVANVPNTYSAADEGKVVSSGALVSQTSQNIDTNGTYDTTLKNEVVVNVSARDYNLEASIIDRSISGTYSNPLVTTVGFNAFNSCSSLTGIDLPNVTLVKGAGFRYSGLTKLYLPKFEYSDDNYAFGNCTSLVTAVLPAWRRSNLPNAFYGDTSLASVDLCSSDINPYSNMSIGQNAFNGCTSFTTLVLRYAQDLTKCTNINAFGNTPFKSGGTGGTIYIPKALYDHLGDGTSLDYKAATNWSTIDGYGTITWAKIEGSAYENAYVDGTPIPTP